MRSFSDVSVSRLTPPATSNAVYKSWREAVWHSGRLPRNNFVTGRALRGDSRTATRWLRPETAAAAIIGRRRPLLAADLHHATERLAVTLNSATRLAFVRRGAAAYPMPKWAGSR